MEHGKQAVNMQLHSIERASLNLYTAFFTFKLLEQALRYTAGKTSDEINAKLMRCHRISLLRREIITHLCSIEHYDTHALVIR